MLIFLNLHYRAANVYIMYASLVLALLPNLWMSPDYETFDGIQHNTVLGGILKHYLDIQQQQNVYSVNI